MFLGKKLNCHSASLHPGIIGEIMRGVTMRWTSIPSKGEEILLVASCYIDRDKLQSDGLLGLYADCLILPIPLNNNVHVVNEFSNRY